jgi:GTPase SAR1 family protein
MLERPLFFGDLLKEIFLPKKKLKSQPLISKSKISTLHNKLAKLYIWDTAGQEKYRSIVSTYFKGCHGVVLVFDHSR